jgi:hypothetical protein
LKINPNLPHIYSLRSEGYIRLGELKAGLDDLYKAAEIYQQQGKQKEYNEVLKVINRSR